MSDQRYHIDYLERRITELEAERDKFAALAETLPRATARIAELEAEVEKLQIENVDFAIKTGIRTAAAVLEEREACRQIAFDQQSDDPPPGDYNSACIDIEAAIRARPAP